MHYGHSKCGNCGKQQATFSPQNTNTLRRIGLKMKIPQGRDSVEYYAQGPWESFVDRQSGNIIGKYTSTIDSLFEQYSHPQTCGNRMALRKLRMWNENELADTLVITTTGQVDFSLMHYDEETFNKDKLHPWELTKTPEVYARFDAYQRGIGDATFNLGVLDKYRCPANGNLSYTIRFEFHPKEDDQQNTSTSINDKKRNMDSSPTAFFSTNGTKINKPQKGINIVQMNNGAFVKMLNK